MYVRHYDNWVKSVVGFMHMDGSDTRMDVSGSDNRANTWPVKCATCTFPDIDFVPQPYWLVKGSSAPGDMAPACFGNFFVQEHVHKILEFVAPKQCSYYPTHDKKTEKQTAWLLAAPATIAKTADVDEKVPRCPKCNQWRGIHPGTHYRVTKIAPIAADIFKSDPWSGKAPWHGLDRSLWFSNRLFLLTKALKLGGFPFTGRAFKCQPTDEDRTWVDEQLTKLAKLGLAKAPASPKSSPAKSGASKVAAPSAWFKEFLKSEAGKKPIADLDKVRAWEKKHAIKLPATYIDYVTQLGSKTFQDVDGTEGFSARVLAPSRLDARSFRKGKIEYETEIDGLMFAATGHGDAFCFDLSSNRSDPSVVLFEHELETFEPYAKNFAEAVKRFAGG